VGRISEETIERIAAASDIVDVVGSYVPLKRAGSSWKGLCPFHHEKTPSFHVNPARQSFHCFGCGAGGSVFRFVMDYEHLDFPAAVRRLAQRAGVTVIDDESAEDQARRGERARMLALHRVAAEWFHANLMKREIAAEARDYLKRRGVGSEIAARWRLGFAPDAWNSLLNQLRETGYSREEILRSGLVIAKDEHAESGIGDANCYDRFRNRVMFPICNDYGEVIAFSGRTLGNDPAKYVNSPETLIFTKGKVLFGLDQSKRAIIEANEAVVCEGQLDLISAFEAGVRNVIAPQGTAFTSNQARLLKRFAEGVVLCFDSDTAGQNAVERSVLALLAAGLSVRVARVPEGQDPDSMIRSPGGPEAFRAVIGAAEDYFDHSLNTAAGNDATPRERSAAARRLAAHVRALEDPALRELTMQKICTRMGITMTAFQEILAAVKPGTGVNDDEEEPSDDGPPSLELNETARLLYRLALGSPAARRWMRDQSARPAALERARALFEKILDSDVKLEDASSWTTFLAGLSEAEERAMASMRLDFPPEDPERTAQEAWMNLLCGEVREEIERVQQQMRAPEISLEDSTNLHKQILDLQNQLVDFRKPFAK
jgi:DNA primase